MRNNQRWPWQMRWVLWSLLGCPVIVLLASYGLLAVRFGTWNLFPVHVHESGRYTLTETIFYFRHFVRELPVNTFVAFVVGIWAALWAPSTVVEQSRASKAVSLRRLAGFSASIVAITAIGMTWMRFDRQETWIELAQFRTRDELSEFGSHWRYHLLHVADSFFFGLGLLLFIRGIFGAGKGHGRVWAWLGVWIVFALGVTAFFGSPLLAFTDPLCLGHEAREIETHRLLTIMPAAGCLLAVDLILGASPVASSASRGMAWMGMAWIAIATLIPVGITLALRHADLPALAGRQSDLWQLAASHHFEHMIDYVYVICLSVWTYLGILRSIAPSHEA